MAKKNNKDTGLTIVKKTKEKAERKRTATLKLSKEDYDLLIPNLDRNLAALKILYELKPDKEKLEKEIAEEAERYELEKKKENLEKLSAKEKEWLQNCLNGTKSFWCFKQNLQYLADKIKVRIDMARVAQHFINDLDVWSSTKLPFETMVDTIEIELNCQHGMLEEWLEDWETPEDEEGTVSA